MTPSLPDRQYQEHHVGNLNCEEEDLEVDEDGVGEVVGVAAVLSSKKTSKFAHVRQQIFWPGSGFINDEGN